MDDRELHQKKLQAQLDEWKAELEKLKAKAEGAEADAQLELNRQIGSLDSKVADAKRKLSELAESSDDAWASIKEGVDASWQSLRSAFSEAAGKFKEKK